MRKMLAVVLVSGLMFTFVNKGKPFEGKVIFKIIKSPEMETNIEFADNIPPEAKAEALKQDEEAKKQCRMVVYLKGSKSREEFKCIMSDVITIGDTVQNIYRGLFNFMGIKYTQEHSGVDASKKRLAPIQINYLPETKAIAGYKCSKARIILPKVDNKEATAEIYYTRQLPNYSSRGIFKGLQGFPMEYKFFSGDEVYQEMIVTDVLKEDVRDSMFIVPKEYKAMTFDEVQKEASKNQPSHH